MATVTIGRCRVTYSVTQNIVNNTSTIKITKVEVSSSSYGGDARVQGTLSCAGKTLISWDYGSMTRVQLSDSWAACNNVNGPTTGAISHNVDGTKKVTISVNFNFSGYNTGTNYGGTSGSGTITLPTIPRTSNISADGVILGNSMSISVSRASVNYVDNISWSCGDYSGTIALENSADEVEWIPPIALANTSPNSSIVDITILTQTVTNSGTEIGSKSIVVQCTIPSSIVPTFTSTVSDSKGYAETYGGYVRSQSVALVETSAMGSYGSTISSISVSYDAQTKTGESVLFMLPNAGTAIFKIVVTDSRGRMTSDTKSINVIDYTYPTISLNSIYRCNSTGDNTPDGEYCKVIFNSNVDPVDNKNTSTYSLKYRERGTQNWFTISLSSFSNEFSVVNGSYVFQVAAESTIEVHLSVLDNFSSYDSLINTLPVAFAMMDFNKSNKSVGIGQRATDANTLNIGFTTKHFGNRITDVGDPADEQDAVTLGWVNRLADEIERTVNRRIAEITAEKIGAAQWKKLWENENKAAAFAAQTVAVDLTGYDMIAVEILAATDAPRCSIGLMNLHGRSDVDCMMTVLYGNRNYYRSVSIGDNGLDFAIGYYGPNYGSSGAASGAKYGIPQTIWGIRNVI